MKFRLEIELNDDAMRTFGDIRYALIDVRNALLQRDLHSYMPNTTDRESVMDSNGNRVGKWEVVEDTPSPAERKIMLPTYACKNCGVAIEIVTHDDPHDGADFAGEWRHVTKDRRYFVCQNLNGIVAENGTVAAPPDDDDAGRTRSGNTLPCEDCGKPQDHCECGDQEAAPFRPFEVIDQLTGQSHGRYETLTEARGCVQYDRLASWAIRTVSGSIVDCSDR